MRLLLAYALLGALLSGCTGNEGYTIQGRELLLKPGNGKVSSRAGNLVTTAIQRTHNLDVVLYPTALVAPDALSLASSSLDRFEIDKVIAQYPIAVKDQFMVGVMSGKSIKEFILSRSSEAYSVELEAAGVEYDISYIGGIPQYSFFTRERGLPLEDEKNYRVAVSKFFFFSGVTFPGYKYRNGFNFSFSDSGKIISVRESLRSYLHAGRPLPFLDEVRARVRTTVIGDVGHVQIHDIQGAQHRSPYYGQKASTRGIVTAVGGVQWYPGGIDVYIQSPDIDRDERTSEALHVYLDDENQDIRLGDDLEVSGVVYEEIMGTGLGRTTLREITRVKVRSRGNTLPPPIQLVREGERLNGIGLPFTRQSGARVLPTKIISSYRGNLNLKASLTMTDAIDFWESLEGMRVVIENARIVGVRGGQEDFENLKPKTYLNLFIMPNAEVFHHNATPAGGVIVDEATDDYNPEMMQIATNHLTYPFQTEKIFDVGAVVPGSLVGVLGYERNLFGDGEFSLVLPELQEPLKQFSDSASSTAKPLSEKPVTTLTQLPNHLTVANGNLENLAGYQKRRLQKWAEAFRVNLKCPDIFNMVEIQDGNGQDYAGGSDASETLENLIALIECPGTNYKPVNIDPINNAEGGEPGGNIRVAMIYNANRVGFEARGSSGSLTDTIIRPDGSLRVNPGRVSPNDPAFAGTRRSLIAEFTFRGERVFIIGNHFNSKLGDASRWDAVQPLNFRSEVRRDLLADKINDFVELLTRLSPRAHILVVGDFNSLVDEDSMKVLEGLHLRNLMNYGGLVAKNDRYTTNHNGNSQPLDYIFANAAMLKREPEFEVLHINTDFMGRLSDHDPLVSRFKF